MPFLVLRGGIFFCGERTFD